MGIIEAMFYECIVISSPHSGAMEIIHHNENGYLAEPGEAYEKSIECIKNYSDLLSIRKNAKLYAKRFSSDNVCLQYEKIYQ